MRRFLTVTVAAALLGAVPASAADLGERSTTAADRRAPGVPAPPLALPGDAATASLATAARADRGTWLVGARETPAARALVRAAGGRRVVDGSFEVPRARARALAARLRARDLLTFAEANRLSTFAQGVPNDPLTAVSPWRASSIDPALTPPAVTPASPLLALVDAKADIAHPEFAGAPVEALDGQPLGVAHGTQTLGTAVAPTNGVGMTGAYPGARALNVPLPFERITCGDSARGIRRATDAGAAVINMSYGSTQFCNTEFVALQRAVKRGVVLVASSGNEAQEGNPFEFPASLPHVLTVAALRDPDTAASFSNTNAAVDLAAPGAGIIAPTPAQFDDDGQPDGYSIVAGTSFSAPIVAAAAQWLRTARPDLTPDQTRQVIRLSATDIPPKQGYDSSTGYGRLNLAAALQAQPPIVDPLEPNEDLPFVNGRVFKTGAAPALWKGGKPATLQALLDLYEDPGDVYRLRVPKRKRVTVTTRPTFGNPDLQLFSPDARNVGQKRFVLDGSRRGPEKRDKVTWRNRRGKARTVFVRVFVRGKTSLDAGYTLTVK